MTTENAQILRQEILDLVARYYTVAFPQSPFIGGETKIPCSGKVFDAEELQLLVDASLDFWLTAGRFADQFEKQFAHFLGLRHALLVNSGSSANLLAISALTSSLLHNKALQSNNEIITVAAGFPTTVNPILQNGLCPVFLDITLPTYNIDTSQLEAALSPRTRGIFLAHTLGNPFALREVCAFAKQHDLWLLEDCCDAVGAMYDSKMVGTFGDIATVSFYPAHHITMGEGGCVITNQPKLKRILASFRDWGRDCWCLPGKDNTCQKRFLCQFGQLPEGYDHKYIYSHIGYNLKVTDMQAAIGIAQLKKLPNFIRMRRENFAYLQQKLWAVEEFLLLPEATPHSEPSWFGFPLSVRKDAPFSRRALVQALEAKQIATRLLFAGNLLCQPAYQGIKYRQIGELANTDFVMRNTFWIGIYPAITTEALDYIADTLQEVIRDFCA
jgi:CDP-6-deoxy-D-xylo-4-hexulose-3-dehydrase